MAAIVNSDGNGGRKVGSQSLSQERAKAEAAAVVSQLRCTPAVGCTAQIKIFIRIIVVSFATFFNLLKMKIFLIYCLCTLHLARGVSQLPEISEHCSAARFVEHSFLLPRLP